MQWRKAQAEQNASAQPAATLNSKQLDQLVAPIALYPDSLLSEVLMASTYPLDVVEAERWVTANKNLTGDALKAAVDKQDWDDSIKSLVATPSVLEMMSTKLDWTQKLGEAVIGQQADVMDAIQRLRGKAQANNKLQSNKQQTVTVSQQQGRQYIAIAPADPDTLYVPYYDPGVVYGDWPYPDYPPVLLAGARLYRSRHHRDRHCVRRRLCARSLGLGRLLARQCQLGQQQYRHQSAGRRKRQLEPRRPCRARLGNRGGREQGLNFRGSNGQRVLNPGGGNRANIGGGNRTNLGERGRPGQHPNVGNRGGNRPMRRKRPARGNGARGGGGRAHAAARARWGPCGGGGRPHVGGGGGRPHVGGGGGMRAHASGGGGFRGGGGGGHRGGGGRGGGGRRSDIRLKHDLVYLGTLDDGLGFYRFSYNGSSTAYVGVMAQDVQQVMPQAVFAGRDGYLRVDYHKLGVRFETYDAWLRSGAQLPATVRTVH